MMHWTARRERMREILAARSCIHPASVFDPLSARIAQDIGFEMGMYAGSTASLTVLGAPDLILLTLTEFAQQALRINRAASIPVMADADHGYGNALNVRRTVEELETAGVAAMTIEDTALPAGFGDKGKARLISLEEGVGKMRAAVDARLRDPSPEDKRLEVASDRLDLGQLRLGVADSAGSDRGLVYRVVGAGEKIGRGFDGFET